MPEDERDEHGIDDLFGDLDEFFAPLEGEEWSEEEGEAAAPASPGADPAVEQVEDFAPKIDIPDEEELLGGLPAADEEAAEDEADDEAVDEDDTEGSEDDLDDDEDDHEDEDELVEAPAASADESAVAVGPEGGLETTAEMSGEEWEKLREALRDEDLPEPAGQMGEAPPADEHELTVDDLRAAPAAYAGLPAEGSDDEEADDDEALEDLEDLDQIEAVVPQGGDEVYLEDEDDDAVLGATEVIIGEDEVEEAPASEESVEAAAAHFASDPGDTPEDVERDLLSDLGGAPEEPVEVEPLGHAPSWQEPAAYAVHEEEEASAAQAAAAGRNMPAALASGVILGGLVLLLLAVGKTPFLVLALAVVLLGQGELYAVLKQRGFHPATALGLVAGAFVMIGAYVKGDSGQGEAAMIFGVVLAMLLCPFWYAAAPAKARRGLVVNMAATMFGVVYVPFMISFALLLLAIPGDLGRNLLLTVLGLTVLYDVCAYAIGSLWGNRPLAPSISPHKSWEGAIGATLIVLLVGLVIVPSIDDIFNPARAAGLALIIAIAAPLGDLAESAIKRDLGVKDMSSLLPGHGGVLDRIDAILFTAPAAYYFVRLFF